MGKGLKIAIGAAISVLLVAALYLFYAFDPETQPVFPKCPFLLATGYECPGCGSQRAVHSLLHLNIGAALRYNAFMLLALPYMFLGIYLEYFGGKKRYSGIEKFFFGRWAALVLLIFILVFWIGRISCNGYRYHNLSSSLPAAPWPLYVLRAGLNVYVACR